jgi:DNA-binding NtrC family response regulator
MSEKVLIVDDELDMLDLLSLIVKQNTDYEVDVTNVSVEVPNMIAAGKGYDVVISDLRMPVLDGIELMEQVRKIDATLPFIVITAYGTIESAVEAVRKGAFDYITKPFHKEQIIHTLQNAMKLRRLHKEVADLRSELARLKDAPEGPKGS